MRLTKTSLRYSLRLRLPLIMSALIAVALTTFLWVAFRQVESTLVETGGARAQGAAAQLANLLAQSTQQRLADTQGAARSAAVRDYLQHPTDGTDDAARQRLMALATPGQPPVELWDGAGARVLTVGRPSAPGENAPSRLAVAPSFSAPGLSAFQVSGDTLFWDAVAEVERPPPEARSSSAPRPLGYVLSRRLLSSAAAADVISRLVGTGAVVEIGNQVGSAWTDLSKVVLAPLVNLTQPGVAEYRPPDGQRRLGALTLIRDTPWAVWVEFPRDVVVAPARIFLTRMLVFELCFVVAAAAVARTLSARITTPLHDLTDAAEAIAAGNYRERVDARRRDEIGRLGAAFNTMAAQVHGVQRELEERVQGRTARLEDAAALLERHIADLNAAREELDGFFELSLDLLCIADLDGRFKRINPAWTDTLGWSVEELMAAPYVEFVHPDDRTSVMNEAAKLAAGGTTIKFETRHRCKDGSYRWLNWKASGSPDRGLIYAAARDITQRKKDEAELEGANQELEAFSYSVSHDLRAPLRHITGFASLLQQQAGERLDEQGRRYTQTIVEAASRMGRLIDDLLAFSRMGRVNLVKKRVSLGDLVRAAQREVTATVSGREIGWTVHQLPDVEGDPEMLRQVIVNLLSNAVKYTATRPRAEIEVGANGRDSGEAVIFVRDNGVGFDMQYAHKLFGVFQRLHSSDEFEGTGIGLANVRRIIHRHGGRTWAEGGVGAGAAFYFSLPLRNGDPHDDRHS